MAFQCIIVSPEEQVLDERVEQAVVPAYDGLVGILTGRAPLLVKLGVGPLRIDLAGGQKQYFFVDGGVAQMKGDKLTILTTEAIPANELDAETARAEYAEAAARRVTDPKSAEDRQHQMARSQAKRALTKSGKQ